MLSFMVVGASLAPVEVVSAETGREMMVSAAISDYSSHVQVKCLPLPGKHNSKGGT